MSRQSAHLWHTAWQQGGAWTCTEPQVTFDWVDRDSGEARRGRIAPATRAGFVPG